MTTVRPAENSELAWINERYQGVGFVPSDLGNEYVAISETDGQASGLGRLVLVEKGHLELGGMYVFEEHRGKGVAHTIVSHLLEEAYTDGIVWCLPFAHLTEFYASFGFVEVQKTVLVPPKAVQEKHQWCNENYGHPVKLLVK